LRADIGWLWGFVEGQNRAEKASKQDDFDGPKVVFSKSSQKMSKKVKNSTKEQKVRKVSTTSTTHPTCGL